jgi:outer membrane protein TolC
MFRLLKSLVKAYLPTSCFALLLGIPLDPLGSVCPTHYELSRCASAQEQTPNPQPSLLPQPAQLPQPTQQSLPTPPALAPTISGKTLDELEALLKAARVELGQRLAKEDQANAGKPETPPASLLDDPVRDGEKRFLELEAIIKERRSQREAELLKASKGMPNDPKSDGNQSNNPNNKDPMGGPQKQPPGIGPTGTEQNQTSPSVEAMQQDFVAMGESLLLADVIASTFRSFPEIEIARLQAGVARGEVTQANGAYDLHLDYYNLNQPVGYYENNRSGVGVSRQLWWGGYAHAGYRIGRGAFEPWYKERETNKGGELRVGWVQPLLQGRAIDPYRVQLFQANLDRQAVAPEIQQNVLAASLAAASAYWQWVEAGNVLRSQEQLLQLAIKRNEGLNRLLERGLSTRQELSINAQTISERQLKVMDSRQKFRDTAFKLAIFLRDESGTPMLARPDWLPNAFPDISRLELQDFESAFLDAQQRRPELNLIQIDLQKLRWEAELARNQTLPNVDFTIQGVQNVGDPATSLNDKGDFILESGVVGGVPVQRRKARGKLESTMAKIQQTEQKRWLTTNKIEMELRVARNALEVTREMVERSTQLLNETRQTLEFFRRDFASGNRDFLFLLAQEAKATEAEIKLLDAEREYYIALAKLQTVLGLDPLEQSLGIEQSLSIIE